MGASEIIIIILFLTHLYILNKSLTTMQCMYAYYMPVLICLL